MNQVGKGKAAGEGLTRECGLLQRIDSAGVERCLGVGAAGPGVTVEVLSPYLVNDRQLDRWEGRGGGAASVCVCEERGGGGATDDEAN